MSLRKKLPFKSPSGRWAALSILLLAAFMDLLDVTIVNVAIPSIQDNLGANYAAIQWVLAGYTLSFAIFLITGGRLGDIFGRKRLFMIGVAGFSLASLFCGLAWSPEILVLGRVLQGALAAMMIPQIMSSMMILFPSAKERLSATSLYGAIVGMAVVGGPIIGGLLIEGNPFNLEWRSIFLVNIPVGIFSLIAAAKLLPESTSPHPLKIDWIGMGLVSTALFALLYPIIQGRELDWPTWSFVMMAASLPLFALFGWYENYKTKKDGSPLMVLELFRERAFISGLIILIMFMGTMSAYFLFVTLFWQVGLDYSPLFAGLAGIPFSIGVGIATGVLTAKLVPKLGRRVLHIGTILLLASMLSIAGALQLFDSNITPWHLIPSFILGGLGMGMVIAPLYNFVIAGVPHRDAGSASGVLNAAHQIGSATGIAVLGVVFFNLLTVNALPSVTKIEDSTRAQLQQIGLPPQAQTAIIDGFKQCFTDQSAAKDQSIEPESCQQAKQLSAQIPAPIAQKISDVVSDAGAQATTKNFLVTFKQTLLYLAMSFVVIFGLVFLLPKKVPEHLPEEAMVH